jgi:N utilization substance protein B
MPLRPETRARARALQLLYAWETEGRPPLEELVRRIGSLTRTAPDVLQRAAALAQGVIGELESLDAIFAGATLHWRLERLALIDRNILRLAVYELTHGLAPPKVVIDEALWLAHRFSGAQSPGFINGVLDQVAHAQGYL